MVYYIKRNTEIFYEHKNINSMRGTIKKEIPLGEVQNEVYNEDEPEEINHCSEVCTNSNIPNCYGTGKYSMYCMGLFYCSLLCINAFLSICSINVICSIFSMNSGFSILSINSIFSIYSMNSVLSVGCTNGYFNICI